MLKSKISVTVFGTCRIYLPLKKLQYRELISLNNITDSNIRTYVHSTQEIIQQIKLCQELIELPPLEIAQYIFTKEYSGQKLINNFDKTDIFFVEISTNKLAKFQGFFLKPYLVEELLNSYKFQNDLDKNTDPKFSSIERNIINEVIIEKLNASSVIKDMLQISSLLGNKKIIFVTHLNAKMKNGEYIPGRDALIKVVETGAEKCGQLILNPTTVAENYDQSIILKNPDQDLTHYSQFFENKLANFIHQKFLVTL